MFYVEINYEENINLSYYFYYTILSYYLLTMTIHFHCTVIRTVKTEKRKTSKT